nr:hypothetical protein [Rhodococcus sp. OK302]
MLRFEGADLFEILDPGLNYQIRGAVDGGAHPHWCQFAQGSAGGGDLVRRNPA